MGTANKPSMNLGSQKLREIMTARGIGLKEVSAASGVHVSQLGRAWKHVSEAVAAKLEATYEIPATDWSTPVAGGDAPKATRERKPRATRKDNGSAEATVMAEFIVDPSDGTPIPRTLDGLSQALGMNTKRLSRIVARLVKEGKIVRYYVYQGAEAHER